MRRLHGLVAAASFVALLVAQRPAMAQELAPPPPMSPSSPGSPSVDEQRRLETSRKLDEAEQKDSGRNFELFWLDGQVGGSYIDMAQFSSSTFQIEKTNSAGPAFSVGAGVRLVLFVLGARLRYNALSAFNMWQINAETGLKIPVSSFDILFGLHGGYSFVGRLDDVGLATSTNTPSSADAVSIRGLNAGLDFGLDYYVTPMFSVGAGVLGDVLFLNRPAVDKPANFGSLTPEQQKAIGSDPLYQKSGTSAGFQLSGGLRLGLHFGL